MARKNINKNFSKKNIYYLRIAPFLLVLTSVFILDNNLAHGVVSGKYFWFYGSIGLVVVTTFIYHLTNKQTFQFSIIDIFVFLFVSSIFLSAWLFGDFSASSTKQNLLALLFCIRLINS